MKRLSKAFQDGLASAADTSAEAFTLIRTVRSFAREENEMSKYGGEQEYFYFLFLIVKIEGAYELAKSRAKGNALFMV